MTRSSRMSQSDSRFSKSTVIRAIITGVAGRMGGTMVRLVSANQDFRVVGGTEQKTSPALGKDIGTLAGIAPLGVAAEPDLDRVLANANGQLVIDFTQSKASTEHARICAARKVALVMGSPGVSSGERLQVAGFA